ncbi:MAG: hypothetical protein ACRDV0_09525 [Acidimicrobiales bacterium]
MSNTDEAAPKSRFRRERRPSMVSREVVMGLDKIERRVSFFASFVAFSMAGLFVPRLLKNTWITETVKAVKAHTCVAPFKWSKSAAACVHLKLTHPSYWFPQFGLLILVAVTILISAYWKKRVGVAFTGFLVGLALGTVGLPFLLLGGWLLIRALRLQRYGDATFFGSSRKARERATERNNERRAARGEAPVKVREPARTRTRTRDKAPAVAAAKAPPTTSKRYTPKKPARKR